MKKVIVVLATLFIAVVANAQTATFQEFFAQFPKANLPYTLGEQDLRNHLESRASNAPVAKAKRLGWEYYDFLPTLEDNARDNRMPVYPEPVAAFETKEYYAVVFNTGRAFARQYKTYNIAVFDKNGKYITTRIIAGVNPTAMAAATISENLEVTIKEFNINWSKDFNTNGFDGNSILNMVPTTVRTVNATAATKTECEDWNYRYETVKGTASTNLAQAK
jgi:hypothetical protein